MAALSWRTILLALSCGSCAAAWSITNGVVSAHFSDAGDLVRVDAAGSQGITVAHDSFSCVLDGSLINSSALAAPIVTQPDAASLVLTYVATAGPADYIINATYRVVVGFAFLSKTLAATSSAPSVAIGAVWPFDALLFTAASALNGTLYPSGDMGAYGVFLRFGDGSGIAAAATNPFLTPSAVPAGGVNGVLVRVGYAADFVWNMTTSAVPSAQPFVADAGLLSFYALSAATVPPGVVARREDDPRRFRVTRPYAAAATAAVGGAVAAATDTRSGMLFEFVSFIGGGGAAVGARGDPSWLNAAERDAFRALGEAFVVLPPGAARRIHIPWTENDYQIDISNATEFAEYERILTQLGRLSVPRILFAGQNSAESSFANATDDWHWEGVLWLTMGEKIREAAFRPSLDAIPPTVANILATAAANGVSLLSYIYPILGFVRRAGEQPPWLYPRGGGGGFYADLSNREFQDFFSDLVVNYSLATRSLGAGYDYTFLSAPDASSYAQWSGWRRILTNNRVRLSEQGDYVVDNRQNSHMWSPWMWAAGSYAEPLQSDEQTTSWTAYVPDIHIDRGDGNRQRQMNYDYAQTKLCQPSTMPGFFSHNTDRCGGPGGCPTGMDWNVRDYDYYGSE